MSATEDEQQSLDAGWDDDPSQPSAFDEEGVDEAWDSLPPPLSVLGAGASSMPPATDAVDSGWDDVAEGPAGAGGKRRPHRPRRAKSDVAPSTPVLLPRPAEPTKKQQREHTRKQRAHEAQVKQQRKHQRKQERESERRREAEERKRQAEAEAIERQKRRAAREQEERARPKAAPRVATKPARLSSPKREPLVSTPSMAVDDGERLQEVLPLRARPSRLRVGVWLTLAVLAAVALLLISRG
jgi:hypothetical protein